MDDGIYSSPLEAAFRRFQQGDSCPLQLFRELFDTILPDSADDAITAAQRYRVFTFFYPTRKTVDAGL